MFIELLATIAAGIGIYILIKPPKVSQEDFENEIDEISDCWGKCGDDHE